MTDPEITPSTSGLAVFIAVVVLCVLGLLVDWLLKRTGLPTITATAQTYPPLAYLILLVWMFGGMGLADHFVKGQPRRVALKIHRNR